MCVHLFRNQPLQGLHSLAFVQKATFFSEIHAENKLLPLLHEAKKRSLSVLPFGEGSNLCFVQDFEGLLIRVCLKGIRYYADADNHYLQVAAGENWHNFVCYCVQNGYPGLENLALIPGSVGAAPIQNIGAYGASLSDYLVSITAYNLHMHAWQTINASDCCFGYRDSLFKRHASPPRYLITSLLLRLPRRWKPILHYPSLQKKFQHASAPSSKEIMEAVIDLRKKKLPDPTILPNAGSFFKNPSVPTADFSDLQAKHPTLRGYSDGESTKLSAAQLIEACGWKGKRFGAVGVYHKHALVLVHYGGASAGELQKLVQRIQNSVKQRFGIVLQPEVQML